MTTRFEFATATRIVFGAGTVGETGKLCKKLGHHALVVTGHNTQRAQRLLESLQDESIAADLFSVSGEPDIVTIQNGVKQARATHTDLVISLGGGSVLDAGKAIAAMLANEGDLLDYLEVIGHGQTLANPSVPFVAIPTTAGTGAEVTRNAVLTSPAHHVKVSLRSAGMLARLAIVDPELTYSLPPNVTAGTGLDALTQVIEPYLCSRSNPLVDSLCLEGMRRAGRSLHVAFNQGDNVQAREDMAVTSLFGGLALANAGLGAVHGFAGPLGGLFPAPHGLVCAALLPHVLKVNLRALRTSQPDSPVVKRFGEVASCLTGHDGAPPEEGIEFISELVRALKVPSLKAYGISPQHKADVVANASKASSMKANPIVLTPEELEEIFDLAL